MKSGYSLRRHLLRTTATSLFFLPLLATAASAGGALPAGGQYAAGKGTIGGTAGSLVVQQSSTTGIIDWNSFSIGKSNSVTFDNGSGATLNEVTGGALSTIAGTLHASGSVYLINQSGIIVSGTGKIVTGGDFVASTQGSDGAQRGNIINAGSIRAAHGSVRLTAANVSMPGRITVERGGQLWLVSSGTTTVVGTLDADNARGTGGAIVATGRNVDIGGMASISSPGAKGGTILIGGDVHGGAIAAEDFVAAPIATAQTVTIAKGAQIFANASKGAGGNVVIWSEGHTNFAGRISAEGKTAGGFAEVSSHDVLAFGGGVDLTASSGKTGTLLLDPYDVTISTGTDTTETCAGDLCSPSGNDSVLNVTTLENALATSRVEVTTGTAGSQAGDITVASPIAWSSGNSLVLDAAGTIAINAAIDGPGAIVDLIAGSTITSSSAGIITATQLASSSSGAATLDADNAIAVLAAVTTGGGAFSLSDINALAVRAPVNTGAGNLTLATAGTNANLTLQAALTGAKIDLVSGGDIISSSSGSITANELTGYSDGNAIFNAANAIGNLGLFTTNNGTFFLADTDALVVIGAINSGTGKLTLNTAGDSLTLDAALTGYAVDLVSAGTITNAAGGIAAHELLGSSEGAVALTGNNQVTVLGAFTTSNGDLTFTDSSATGLLVGGAVSVGGGNLTLTTMTTAEFGQNDSLIIEAPITGAVVDLESAYLILSNSAGIITAGTMMANAGEYAGEFANGESVLLNAPNRITDLGASSAVAGDFLLTNAAPLVLTDSLKGDVISLVSSGTITQNAGVITATTLTGSSSGATTLNGENQVQNLGGFTTANGDFSLTNFSLSGSGGYGLAVTGAVDAGSGNLTLSAESISIGGRLTGGVVDLSAAGNIGENNVGRIVTPLLIGGSGGDTSLGNGNQIQELGTFTGWNGGAAVDLELLDDASLTVIGGINAALLSLSTTAAGHNLTIDAPINVMGIELVSAGTINQSDAGTITASELSDSRSHGNAILTASNAIGMIDGFSTDNGNLSLADTVGLTVFNSAGSLNVGTGTLSLATTGTGNYIAVDGEIAGATINLTSSGDITEGVSANPIGDGTLTTGLLNVTANTGITLANSGNDITAIGIDHTNSGPNTIDQN